MIATPARIAAVCSALAVLLIAVTVASLFVGTARISPAVLYELIKGGGHEGLTYLSTAEIILFRIRLPRILMAGVAGAALSISGVVMQALLRNPLAEPYILGVSGGAAVGAILAILAGVSASSPLLAACAFLTAILTVSVVFVVAGTRERIRSETVLLAGVIVNAFFAAVIMFLISTTTDERIHSVMFWLMGDFSFSSYREVVVASLSTVTGLFVVFSYARSLNLMVSGEAEALYLGVDVRQVKMVLLGCVSVMTAVVVSFSGIVGFVGLMVPHVVRMALGPDHRLVIPASLLVGAAFMIFSDTLARWVLSPTELPVGVVTAFFGAPFFLYILRRRSY